MALPDKNFAISLLYARYLKLWTKIVSFRSFTHECINLESTEKHFRESYRKGFLDFAMDSVFHDTFIKIVDDNEQFEKTLDETVKAVVENVRLPIDAAGLVFMHSILDTTIYRLLEFLANYYPADWHKHIKDKKFALEEIQGKTYEELQQIKAIKAVEDLKNCSLLNRCKIILDICNPQDVTTIYPNYAFNEQSITSIDNIRHDIIHALQIDKSIENPDREIDYLKRTGLFFIHMVLKNFNLQVMMAVVGDVFTKNATR